MDSRAVTLATLMLIGCGSSKPPAATSPTTATSAPAEAKSATPQAPATSEDAGTPTPSASATAPEEDTSGTPKQRLMRSHFKETVQIQSAVIDGRLEATAAPAAALGDMKGLGTIQASWKAPLSALKTAADRFAQSPDLPAATAAIADIGVACGNCHRAGGGPKLEVGAPPAVDKTLPSQMKRHAWALERLWEGLYVPSDAAWKAGADALAGYSFPNEVLKKGGVHARSAATKFDEVVPTLASKQSSGDRAKVYAALLETCSACHMAARK